MLRESRAQITRLYRDDVTFPIRGRERESNDRGEVQKENKFAETQTKKFAENDAKKMNEYSEEKEMQVCTYILWWQLGRKEEGSFV